LPRRFALRLFPIPPGPIASFTYCSTLRRSSGQCCRPGSWLGLSSTGCGSSVESLLLPPLTARAAVKPTLVRGNNPPRLAELRPSTPNRNGDIYPS
jgi:hypothetical protein